MKAPTAISEKTRPSQCDPLERVNMYNPTVAAGLGGVDSAAAYPGVCEAVAGEFFTVVDVAPVDDYMAAHEVVDSGP